VRRVILPVIRPGILAGAVFAFILSWDEIVVTLFISQVRRLHPAAPAVERHAREYRSHRRRGGGRPDLHNPRLPRRLRDPVAQARRRTSLSLPEVRLSLVNSHENRLLLETVQAFMKAELHPHEDLVDKLGEVPLETRPSRSRSARMRPASMPPTCRRRSAAAA